MKPMPPPTRPAGSNKYTQIGIGHHTTNCPRGWIAGAFASSLRAVKFIHTRSLA